MFALSLSDAILDSDDGLLVFSPSVSCVSLLSKGKRLERHIGEVQISCESTNRLGNSTAKCQYKTTQQTSGWQMWVILAHHCGRSKDGDGCDRICEIISHTRRRRIKRLELYCVAKRERWASMRC